MSLPISIKPFKKSFGKVTETMTKGLNFNVGMKYSGIESFGGEGMK